MAEPTIRDHVWRPPPASIGGNRGDGPRLERPCEYLTCGRPLAEHALPATGPTCKCPVFDPEQPYDELCNCDHAPRKHENQTGACKAALS